MATTLPVGLWLQAKDRAKLASYHGANFIEKTGPMRFRQPRRCFGVLNTKAVTGRNLDQSIDVA